MRPGREMDTRIAQEIFGHRVYPKNKVLHENAEKGERPLRRYSKDMEWAWEVATKMRISLIPIAGGEWFAFAADNEGWADPKDLMRQLESGDFALCGAAVGPEAAEVICRAALVAAEKRRNATAQTEETQAAPPPDQLLM